MNILITGAAGFIGSHLVHFLLKKDYHVFGIDNFITGNKKNISDILDNPRFTFIENDLTSCDLTMIPSCNFIFHLASPASPIQYKKYPIETLMANSLGTKNVLDFMKKTNSKTFVITSTSEVYGDPLVHPQKESYWGNVNPNGVRSCYDESKRFAESLVMAYFRTYQLDIRIARLFNTYGPNMEQNDGRVVSNFILQSIQNKPITIYGEGNQTRSFCYVFDMVKGLYQLAITKDIAGEVVNLGNPNEKTILELAHQIKMMTSSSSLIVHSPLDQDDPKKRKPDISKAKKLLCWEPTISLEKGLEETITYFKQELA